MNALRSLSLLAAVLVASAVPSLAADKPKYTDAEAAQHIGDDATVTGRVVNVSKSGKGNTFLNFGDRYPNQTFGAVIFASKEAEVGDVKQYEGKEVAITGKIEKGPDGKPQIVIRSADQIKLASDSAS